MKKLLLNVVLALIVNSLCAQLDLKTELEALSQNYNSDCMNYSMQTFEYKVKNKIEVLQDSTRYRVFKSDDFIYSLNDELESILSPLLKVIVDHSEMKIFYERKPDMTQPSNVDYSQMLNMFLQNRLEYKLQHDFFSNANPNLIGLRLYMDNTTNTKLEIIYNRNSYQMSEAKLFISVPEDHSLGKFTNRILHSMYTHYECGDMKGINQISDFFNLKGKKPTSLKQKYKSYSTINISE